MPRVTLLPEVAGAFYFFNTMVNIDTRLLDKVDENEMWLLVQLARRINGKEKLCWPSNKTLCKDTDWNIDKVQRVKKSLMEKGLLEIIQRPETSNVYKLTTPYLSIYIRVDECEFEELPPTGKNGTPPTLFSGTPPPVKNGSKVLTNEVLTNELSGVILFKDRVNRSQLIIEALNNLKKTFGINGQVRWTKERATMIEARIKEWKGEKPYKEICAMMEHRCKVWKGTEWQKFIRIETLFQPKKFVGYMEEAEAQPEKDWTERRTGCTEVMPEPSIGNISW